MDKSKITPAVAVTALAVAVLGATPVGHAATGLLKKNSVGSAQLKKDAVTSAKVKDHSLLADDFKAGQLPKGDKGDPGPPGPYPDQLPSGKTVRGAYSVSGTAINGGNIASSGIPFGFALASAPTAHYIPVGGQPSEACPGNAASPEAARGHLCVYEGFASNVQDHGFVDPLNWNLNTSRRYGAIVWIIGAANGVFMATGSWAVTAP
jgi:hypothetical protein